MRRVLAVIFIFADILVSGQSRSALFIGNSYTYTNDMPQIVADLASSSGDSFTFGMSCPAGYTLHWHTENSTTLGLIDQGGWDFVVLQEYSQYPSEPQNYVDANVYPAATFLDGEINTHNPGAETVFYMTWGRRDGDADRCPVNPAVCTYAGMDDLTRQRYMTMTQANHAIISPVGAVWRWLRQNYPSIELYQSDGSHPSAAGSYAAACSFYTAFFRKDPSSLTYNFTLSSSDAAIIRNAARLVVYDSLLTWHIGEYDPDILPPSVPSGLACSNISTTSFTLSWSASTDNKGVEEYQVMRNGILYTTTPGTSVNISGLSPSTTYAMTVLAKDAAGNVSSSSSALNVTTASSSAITLTISGVTAGSRAYNGTTAATLNVSAALLVGITAGDAVTLVTSGASGTFSSKDAGNGKAVITSGFSLAGADAGKYILTQPVTTANITTVGLTITGLSVTPREYDGTTAANLNTGNAQLAGVISGDNVSLVSSEATGAYSGKAAGTGKLVTTSGFTLYGADRINYTLAQPSLTGNITPAQLTISGVTAANKVYDGTTAATINTGSAVLVGVLPGDAVVLNSGSASGVFENANTGIARNVIITGFTISGNDAGNYTLIQPAATASITGIPLTLSGVTANNKVYDGTTVATLNTSGATLTGMLAGDVVTIVSSSATGTFSNWNAGSNKSVTTSGFTLAGADAAKYLVNQPVLSASITPAVLTITGLKAYSRFYDGTTKAVLNTESGVLTGVIGSDNVMIISTNVSGTFANKYPAVSKPVTTAGFAIEGEDSDNYTLTQPSATGTIRPAPLTVTGIKAENKVYDGTTSAVINISGAALNGIYSPDVVSIVSIGVTAAFSTKNAGTSVPVLITGFALSGTDAGNYSIEQPEVAADIAARTVSLTAQNLVKNYHSPLTFSGTEFSVTGLVQGDPLPSVFLSSPGAAELAAAGVYPITITGGTLQNYSVVWVNGTLTVMKNEIIATADNKSRVYGMINPKFTITYSGFVKGEDISVLDVQPVATSDASENSDAGTYPITLSGGSDSNYNVVLVNGSLEIRKATLTVTAENKTRPYGSPNPPFTFAYTGFVFGQTANSIDNPPIAATSADMDSDVGDYEISLSGGSDNNYTFLYIAGKLSIAKGDQEIHLDDFPGSLRITRQYQLKATATSQLPVSFELSDQTIASLSGDMLTINEEGELTITARQEGDQNWNAAPDVVITQETLPTFDNISSLFTPNSDGMNDYWHIPRLDDYGTVQVTVYNRYGQVVYKSDNYNNDWDGTYNGSPLPSAAYYYIIKSSEKGFIKGVVNIVR
jgi:gliding motility-associated-like protein